MRGKSTERMVLGALFAALTAVCAQVIIPIGTVPVSLSLLPVLLCGAQLRPWDAAAAMAVYILMGLAGLPVFSNLEGRAGKLLGPTGGYIIGYLPCALLTGLILRKSHGFLRTILAMACGVLVCYAFGTVWFCVVKGNAGSPMGFLQAAGICVLPYLIPDGVKLLLADQIAVRVRKALVSR